MLLVFANDRQSVDAGWLRDLAGERRSIIDALFVAEREQHCRIVADSNVTHRSFFDLVVRHRRRIVGVHFGGHADPGGLQFEDQRGSPSPARMDAIAETLSELPALRWVFLNGCGTAEHVGVLHARIDAPIIATERAVRDDVARGFAHRFYFSMAHGETLAMAFRHAEREVQAMHLDATGIVRSGEMAAQYFAPVSTRMLRPGAGGDGSTRWPWVLRCPDDATAATEWRLVDLGTSAEVPAVAFEAPEEDAGEPAAGPPEAIEVSGGGYGRWAIGLGLLGALAAGVVAIGRDGCEPPPPPARADAGGIGDGSIPDTLPEVVRGDGPTGDVTPDDGAVDDGPSDAPDVTPPPPTRTPTTRRRRPKTPPPPGPRTVDTKVPVPDAEPVRAPDVGVSAACRTARSRLQALAGTYGATCKRAWTAMRDACDPDDRLKTAGCGFCGDGRVDSEKNADGRPMEQCDGKKWCTTDCKYRGTLPPPEANP